jgi:glutaminyl-tRNA synthetase
MSTDTESSFPATNADNYLADGAGGEGNNFIREIIDRDLAEGRYDHLVTRFPPEPNGYLHIGHAKSIVLNFGLANDYGGRCHLRFDDTNPETENLEYVESIKDAVAWLGYDWGEHLYFASDYFEQFYQYAVRLIRDEKAYVDSLDPEEISSYRGTVNEPGTPSPYRDRSVSENLELFEAMRSGEFADGEHVLRARIDMSSPHMILRDPLLYRIKHAEHYRQGDEWCIYPMYDFAHPLEDAIESVTHSLCTLEFDTNRVLYDWVLENCLEARELPTRPRQYEFNRLNLDYTVMSKRKLRQLIEEGRVDGWDDPRLPTIAALRRRGVTPEAIRSFCRDVGVTRTQGRVQFSHFEHSIRDDLNYRAPRVMGVVDPLRVVVTNFPEDETDWIEAPYWPRDIDREGTREIPFTRELYIDRDDFREDPPKGFYRLTPGREVRLRYGYFVTCEEVVRNEKGQVVEVRCTYDPATRGGDAPDGRSPKGTIHWLSATHALPAEMRSYDRLFSVSDPDERDEPFVEFLNEESLVVTEGYVEPSVADDPSDQRYQFERIGYFWQDPEESTPDRLIYNQIVTLRDTWAEQEEIARQEEMERRRREKEREKERHRQRSIEGLKDPAEDLSAEERKRFEVYVDEYGLDRGDAAVIAGKEAMADFFETSLQTHESPETVSNWIVNDLMRVLKKTPIDELPFGPSQFAAFVALVDDEVISTRAADEVFEQMIETGADPEAIVDEQGLRQVDDADALEPVVEKVIENNPEQVEQYRGGKEGLLGFFMGQVMGETGGTANPQLAKDLLQKKLNG